MYAEIDRQLGKTMREINRSGFIKMTMKKSPKEIERELYTPSENYETVHKDCCEVDVKVGNLDKEILV